MLFFPFYVSFTKSFKHQIATEHLRKFALLLPC